MPSASGTGSDGATSRRHRASRTPRASRTLVAVVGIACLAVTAAAADPVGVREQPAPQTDVFAAGPGGFGTLDLPAADAEQSDEAAADASSRARVESLPDGGLVDAQEYVDPFVDPFLDTVDLTDPGTLGSEDVLASAFPPSLQTGQMPAVTLRAYRAAAEVLAREQPTCGIDWAPLAAIGRVESNHGRFGGATVTADGRSVPAVLGVRLDGSLAGTMVIRDTDAGALDGDVVYDRAVGPMQFLPGTWARWGSDGDRDGDRDPQNINDAALAAARYLCSGDGGLDSPGPAAAAVRRYNHSSEYVQLVLATAQGYRGGGPAAFFDGAPSGYAPVGPLDAVYPGAPGWSQPARPVLPSTVGVPDGPTPSSPSPSTTPSRTATPSGTTRPTSPVTASPTPSVTVSPTASPTGRPSASPSPTTTGGTTSTTAGPTASPTTSPTGEPTSGPTGEQTSAPTGEPTTSPTASPSGTPSAEPSGEQTTAPTATPAPDPSDPAPDCEPEPTVTPSPTASPTGQPCPPLSCAPAPSPTAEPTDPQLVCEPAGPAD